MNVLRHTPLAIGMLLLASCTFSATAQEPPSAIEAEWNEIVLAESNARFDDAAKALRKYIHKWLKNDQSFRHLEGHYRLGTYLERAKHDDDAAKVYQACLKHPRIDDPGATINGGIPIRVLAQRGLIEIAGRRSPQSPAIVAMRWSSKDGIVREIQRFRSSDAPTPLQSLDIASRPMTIDNLELAAEISKGLVAKMSGRPDVEIAGNLVVAAVRSPDSKATKQLANDLLRIFEHLRESYGISPPNQVLYVYASLDGGEESTGEDLSRAVHFATMADLEGYFNSLDNSVVFRKNVWFREQQSKGFALGTAYHEFTHALIAGDFPTAPLWLNEGIASLMEEQDSLGPIDNYRLYFLRGTEQVPALGEVLDSGHSGWTDLREPLFAAMARYLAFYIWNRDRTGATLRAIYTGLKESASDSESSLAVFRKELKMDESELQRELGEFVRTRDIGRVDQKWSGVKPSIERWIMKMKENPALDR